MPVQTNKSMRVYLAGPDVFYPDAVQRGRQMVELCRSLDIVGLYPLDPALDSQAGPLSKAIFHSNLSLIDNADAVVANLRDWRGFEPDSGTVWEAAYAYAKGKPVVAYLPQASTLIERMAGHHHQGVDSAGCTVEDFGLPLNLMLAHSLTDYVYGAQESLQGLRAALVRLKSILAQCEGS